MDNALMDLDQAAVALPDPALYREDPGLFLRELWRVRVAQFRWFAAAEARLIQVEREARNIYGNDAQLFSVTAANGWLEDTARSMLTKLLLLAVRKFTPAGCGNSLVIDNDDYLNRFVQPCYESRHGGAFDPDRFDPSAIWEALEADYGAGKALERLSREAAEVIETGFALRPGSEVERSRSGIILSHFVCIDPTFSDARHKRLAWSHAKRISQLFRAIRTFAHWADDTELGNAAVVQATRFDKFDVGIVSRSRITVTPRLSLTTYQTRFVWWFEQSLAEQLQVFLSMYGKRVIGQDC